MRKKITPFIMVVSIIFTAITFFSCKVSDDTLTGEQEQLIEELDQWIIPIASPLNLTDNEMSFLNQVADAKIVGLGEATHGTKEFFQMKHRIFQYLVEHHGHKGFGFEADFAESLYINKYINTGEGDLEDIMKTRMHFWTWRTKEVKELLQWMKNYNTGKPKDQKIHYYGFDCQFTTYQPELLQEYLLQASPALWDVAAPIVEQIRLISSADYENMEAGTFNDLKTQLESLEEQIITNKELLILNSSSLEYEIHKQLLITFRQAFIFKHSMANNTNSYAIRDRFMAENALWLGDLFGKDTRITLWAHNMHVARDPSFAGTKSMGYHLGEALNEMYRVIGFSFSQGSFTASGTNQNGDSTGLQTHEINDEPLDDSINVLFHHASQPNFVFHLYSIPTGSQWDDWIKLNRPFLSIGAVYDGDPISYYNSTKLRQEYDWVVHFDNTQASELL